MTRDVAAHKSSSDVKAGQAKAEIKEEQKGSVLIEGPRMLAYTRQGDLAKVTELVEAHGSQSVFYTSPDGETLLHASLQAGHDQLFSYAMAQVERGL
jgi:hypothetical protein